MGSTALKGVIEKSSDANRQERNRRLLGIREPIKFSTSLQSTEAKSQKLKLSRRLDEGSAILWQVVSNFQSNGRL